MKILRKLRKQTHAVSPVIATLMLVLVSVGSAGAFYMWQSGWQGDVETKAGGADLKSSLTIAGSTTVYPFTAVAVELFESDNTNYKVSYQAGGSGAGVHSVSVGAVDIGSASRNVKSSERAKYPDLNEDGNKDLGKELVETLVAYDAVVMVVNDANPHGLIDIDLDTVQQIYGANGGVSGTYSLDTSGNDLIEWNEVPVSQGHAIGDVETAVFDGTGLDDMTSGGTYSAQGKADYVVEIDATGTPDTFQWSDDGGSTWNTDVAITGSDQALSDGVTITFTSTTGHTLTDSWSFSAYGSCIDSTGTEVTIYDRAEHSGTEETFSGMIFDTDTLEEAGCTATHCTGNEEMLSNQAGDEDCLGFMSYGFAAASDSGVTMIPFHDGTNGLIDPNDGDFEGNVRSDGKDFYEGARKLFYVTVGEPTGAAKLYIDFCLAPRMNMDICEMAGYIPKYS